MNKNIRFITALSISYFLVISFVLAIPANKLCRFHKDNAQTGRARTLNVHACTLLDSIYLEVIFPQPNIDECSMRHSVKMQDLPRHSSPGEPVLPFQPIKLLIPKGKEVENIAVSAGKRRWLEGSFTLEYGKTPVAISSRTHVVDKPKKQIYTSTNPFPGVLFSRETTQYLRGYRLLLFALHPVQYIPKAEELYYYESMSVTVDLRETGGGNLLLRNKQRDKMLVENVVVNPDALETYTIESQMQPTSVDPSKSYDYVIVTDSTLNSSFQPLVDWKIHKGLNATTVLVGDILNDVDYFCNGQYGDGNASTFNDTAARIRNFIRDAYQNWETEYVLLGGDTEIIPERGVYAFVDVEDPPSPYTVDRDLPCDMYYGALDGSWDNDNDTIFGEEVFEGDSNSPENGTAGEEADFFAEVYIGRAPVSTIQQADNFVNKTLWYEQNSDDSYFQKALMIGETLDVETEGGNNKDMVTDLIPQYTTTRLYDRDGTYSSSAVVDSINGGVHVLNHDGHTNANSMMGLDCDDIDTLFNNTEYFFGYSLGCHAGAFDGDSVVEHFLFNPHGAFAFVSNSRYGWYLPGSTMGPGGQFDREFFSVLNNTVRNVAKTLQFSKENKYTGSITSANRWTYFELNLLGDPETELITDVKAPTAHFDTNPTAKRLSPATLKGCVNLKGISKKGTATGATFANFTVEFGKGKNPISWKSTGIQLVDNGQNEVVNDVFATWNTSLVNLGTYTIRLNVRDTNGTIGQDKWIVKVEELPAIRVNPQLIATQEGLTFTVSVEITDPEDLYGFAFQMNWNATLLDHVSHILFIPREDYRWGVLHEPVQITKDELNQTSGTYTIAAKSSHPASPFNEDGIVFNMTFQAKNNGTCELTISSSNLTEPYGDPIPHSTFAGIVEIAPGIHNVAVTDLSASKCITCLGYPTDINVKFRNNGTFAETFNFTIYANTTNVNTTQITLPPFNTLNVIVPWDTTGWLKGNYTISANITSIQGEVETSDNSLTDGQVYITIAGDVDGNKIVDIYDVVKICGVYSSQEEDLTYVANYDINGDGIIDIYDVVIACSHYGETW